MIAETKQHNKRSPQIVNTSLTQSDQISQNDNNTYVGIGKGNWSSTPYGDIYTSPDTLYIQPIKFSTSNNKQNVNKTTNSNSNNDYTNFDPNSNYYVKQYDILKENGF